jgi:hypothetical protein
LNEIIAPERNLDVLVKVDTEGHEPVVFTELRRLSIWPRVKLVFFEVDEAWFSSEVLISTLRIDGFREAWRFLARIGGGR